MSGSGKTAPTMKTISSLSGSLKRRPGWWALAGLPLVTLAGFALYWFAPWNLVVDRRVDEAIPTAADPGTATDAGEMVAGQGEGTPPEDETVASGEFRSLEHSTTGVVLILELEDGRRFLRLEDLETSNGPDLRVLLTDQPASDDWHVWDDGRLVDLGALKGNVGSSNYAIPDDLDLSGFQTAVIWCRRFSVGFGVAPLEPAS